MENKKYKFKKILSKFEEHYMSIKTIKEIVADFIIDIKPKSFLVKTNLIPLNFAEIREEMEKYISHDGLYCYLGIIYDYKKMEEMVEGFKKLVIEIEVLDKE